MPATSLTKVTATNFGDGVADVGFEAVDQPNGNDFVNTGKTVMIVENASGGNVNATFTVGASKYTVNDAITKTPNGPVAAADVGLYGPFPTAIYGSTVTVNWDVGASISVAVVELEDTPL
jgi:hypothetical protein